MNALLHSTDFHSRHTASLRPAWLALLLLVVFLSTGFVALHAQDFPADNPTGPTGDYNGEVTTAGSYDPFTQNAKRSITDLVVPGSNGTYPLAFSRIYNSAVYLVGNEPRVLGDGGNWRHSYMWTLLPVGGAYNVAYPDGGVITFKSGRPTAPTGEYATYWRGPTGTADRLEVTGNGVVLHKSDGGLVYFGGNFRPYLIVDPYGAVTKLDYDGANFLTKVTEPGGRWLSFHYTTYSEVVYDDGDGATQSWTWVLLTQVEASTGQKANYGYDELGGRTFSSGVGSKKHYTYIVPYKVLTAVEYLSEPKATPPGNVQASYSYEQVSGSVPVLSTALDPHYAGAMVGIRYLYTNTASGLIQEEQNLNTTRVSKLARTVGVNTSSSVETRGDKDTAGNDITRTFTYGEPTINGGPSYAKPSQVTSYTDYQGNTTHLSYYGSGSSNGEGNLFSSTDALGHSTLYGHEKYTGKTYAMQLPDGRVRYWLWLGKNMSDSLQPYYLIQSTDERGQSTTYFRDSNTGLVTQIDYPDGGHEYFSYTGFNYNGFSFYKVHVHTDQRGAQTIYGYDETDVNHGGSGHIGLPTSVTRSYADGNGANHQERTVLYYDGMDRLTQSVDKRGVTKQFAYSPRHQLTLTTNAADGTTVGSLYDDNGNCYYVLDELGHGTSTYYDEYRRVTRVVQSVNDGPNTYHTTDFAYDPRNDGSASVSSAISHTRSQWSVNWVQSGKGTERIFSPNGWLTRTYSGIGASTGGPNGTMNVGGGPGLVWTDATYSSVGQVLSSIDTQNQTSTFTYDVCGRKKTATDPNGHVTTWNYYGPNQPSSSTNYAGWLQSVTAPGPDINANSGTVTTTYSVYDKMGRATTTVDPYNHNFIGTFNTAGDLTAQTDGAQASGQHNTGYGYDQLGRKVSVTNPATGAQEKWTYDDSGNVQTYQNYAGTVRTYTYDMRNRCTGYSWTGGAASSTTYIYDAASRMTDVNNANANIHYTYDNAGEVLTEQITHKDMMVSGTTTFKRDQDGNLVNMVYPSGASPQFAYDYQQRCTGVYSGSTTFSAYTYTSNHLFCRSLLNHTCTYYDYQANGRPLYAWHMKLNPDGTFNKDISRHYCGYEPNGQLSWFRRDGGSGTSGSTLENGNGDAFAYWPDGSLRLASRNYAFNWPAADARGDSEVDVANPIVYQSTADTYKSDYSHDAAGNRSFVHQGNPQQPIGYAATGDNKYYYSSYDANNNTTNSNVGWTYTYDAENHLTSAAGPSPQSGTFRYDGLGRLCTQNVGGVFTRFYYAGSQRIEEHDYSNTLVYRYIFDAPGSDRILYREGNYGRIWYQYDLLGNTSHLTDPNGTVIEQYLYDAYGQPSVYNAAGNVQTSTAGSGVSAYDNRYLFKGAGAYEWIASMSTYYARARFYLPFHGRWLQPDPIGQSGGLNIYTYCKNDPVNGADPSGLQAVVVYAGGQANLGTSAFAQTGFGLDMGRGPFSPMSWKIGTVTSYTNTAEGNYTYGNPSAGGYFGLSLVPSANSLSDLGGQSSGYSGGLSFGEGGKFGLNVGVSNISQDPSIESPRSYDFTLSLSGSANVAPVSGSVQQSNSWTDTGDLSKSGEEVLEEAKQGWYEWVRMKLFGVTQQGPNGGNIHSNYVTVPSIVPNYAALGALDPASPYFGQPEWDLMGYGNRIGNIGNYQSSLDLRGAGGGANNARSWGALAGIEMAQ